MIQRNEARPSTPKFVPEAVIIADTPVGYIRYEARVIRERNKGLLVKIRGVEVWLPKKVVVVGVNKDKLSVVDLPEWLAEKHKYFEEGYRQELKERKAEANEHCLIYDKITQTTEKAYEIRLALNKQKVWFPKVSVRLAVNKKGENIIYVPDWLVRQNGLGKARKLTPLKKVSETKKPRKPPIRKDLTLFVNKPTEKRLEEYRERTDKTKQKIQEIQIKDYDRRAIENRDKGKS